MLINNIVAVTFFIAFNYFQESSSVIYNSILNKIERNGASQNHNECIMDMIKLNFKRNATTTIFSANNPEYSRMESNLLKDIFTSINSSVFLSTQMTQKKISPLGVRRNFIVILGKKSLKVVLGILHSFYIWDSKAIFMVVLENLQKQKKIILEDIENYTREYDMSAKVIVEHITLGSNLEPITEHYVSNPSKVYRAKKAYEKLSKIGSCERGSARKTPLKLHSKMIQKIELRVGLIHSPPFLFITQPDNTSEKILLGSESKLISTVAEKLNMTVHYEYYSNMDSLGDVEVLDGNNIHGSGMLNDLLLNNIDIAVGNIVVSERVHHTVAISMSYSVDRITWILPEPRSILKLPFFPFIYDFKITLFLIAMYLIFPYMAYMATNHFHKSSNDECGRYKTYRGTCITYFAMSTGSTVDIYPKTIRMKFFLFIWLFYTYHLNMYFSSTLIWFFAVEQYAPKLKTSTEVTSSGMELGIDSRTYNYFKDQFFLERNYSAAEQVFYDKLIICNSTSFCLSKVKRDRNFSMTLSYNYFSFVKHMFKDKNGKFLMMSIPEAIVSYPIGIIFKKGFWMQRNLNRIVLKINEAGLFNHWSENTRHDLKNKRLVTTESNEDIIDANYALKYDDLKMVFFGMIIELFVCFLVFICELITHKWNNYDEKLETCSSKTNGLFDYVN